MNQQRSQSFLVTFVLVIAIAAMIYMAFQREGTISEPLTINEVAQAIQTGKVEKISIEEDNRLIVVYTDGSEGNFSKGNRCHAGGSTDQPGCLAGKTPARKR